MSDALAVLLEPLGEAVHAASACRRGAAGPIGGAVGGTLDAGVAQGGDVLEGEQLVTAVEEGAAQFGTLLADRVVEDRLEAAMAVQQLRAVFGPTPLAPGS